MRYLIGILATIVLAGCAGSPPKPPLPEGDYRPVNRPVIAEKQSSFDFDYAGDILGVLPALSRVAPQIRVMPSLGTPHPLAVRVSLRQASLEEALRAIGEQCGDVADVVWNTTRHQGGNQVFIRFREPGEAQQGSMK